MSGAIPLEELQREALAPSDDAMVSIAELAERQIEAENNVEIAANLLKQAQIKLDQLSQVDIPTAMQACGMSEFKLADGTKISCKEFVRAAIPKAKLADAFAWLEANGHADLIKNVVSASFGKGEDEAAQEALAALADIGAMPSAKRSVAPPTLGAFVREQRELGIDVPEDLLGVYVGFKTKIERSK